MPEEKETVRLSPKSITSADPKSPPPSLTVIPTPAAITPVIEDPSP